MTSADSAARERLLVIGAGAAVGACRHAACRDRHRYGESSGIKSGFIVFIENHELVLECHAWGADAVPDTYRDENVRITAT
jgi:hypothetical protein